MTQLHRAFTVALAVLLAGVAIGDAAGVVLCVEADGRAVLEMPELADCCSDDSAEGRQAATAGLSVSMPLECGPCVDFTPPPIALRDKSVQSRLLPCPIPANSACGICLKMCAVQSLAPSSAPEPSGMLSPLSSVRILR